MSFEPYHAKYDDWLMKWTRQRDVIEGEDAVKAKGTKYLPALDGQDKTVGYTGFPSDRDTIPVIPYSDYIKRANFLNMTSRTVESLAGAILRKEPSINWPDQYKDELETLGVGGASVHELTDSVVNAVIGIGRHGHLVDAPNDIDNALPFISEYSAESITNWKEEKIEGRRVVSMVVLEDEPEVIVNASGETKELQTFRRLMLGVPQPETDEELKMPIDEFLRQFGLVQADFASGPTYFQEIWQEIAEQAKTTEKEWIRIAIMVPRTRGGRLLNYIPFTFFNPGDTKPKPSKPPLLDLAILNLSHYRNSADLEHGLHFTGLPQPWAAGFDFKGPLFIGSSVAWVSSEPTARAGYLEFSGAGLASIERAMEAKKKEAAVLGARILEERAASGVEAAETVKLRHSGEQSVLSRISMAISEGISNVLGYWLDWVAYPNPKENGTIALNNDFNLVGLSPQMLTSLMLAVQSGKMSWATFFWNLQRGEVIPDERTEEEEFALIQAGGPMGMELPTVDEEDEKTEEPPEETASEDDV